MIMGYDKRFDGRKQYEMRPMSAKVGVVPRADGSAMFQIGKTTAIAAVYGPRDLHPKFLQNPRGGLLRCHYSMMPFSGHGERVRPGQNRRAKEISRVMEASLRGVVDLNAFPNAVVDVFIELPQTDAGTRCAGICAASMALADAGLDMKDMVAAVSAGFVHDRIVADLTYEEEHYNEFAKGLKEEVHVADIPIACQVSNGEIVLLQMDGKVSAEFLAEALEVGKKACAEIGEVQRKALKERFTGGSL